MTNNSWNSQKPVQVAKGGTGIITTTAYAPIVGGTSATGAFQAADTDLATANYVLTSNGAAAVPSFKTAAVTPKFLQYKYAQTTSAVTINSLIPSDGTIPQKTEGNEVMTCTITPTNANNILIFESYVWGQILSAAVEGIAIALFQDATANALAANWGNFGNAGSWIASGCLFFAMVAGTTSATTFKIRVGKALNNSDISITPAFFGGVQTSFFGIKEVVP